MRDYGDVCSKSLCTLICDVSVVVKNDSSNYILQKHMLPEKQLEEKMRQSGRIVSKRKENIKMRIGTEGTPICR